MSASPERLPKRRLRRSNITYNSFRSGSAGLVAALLLLLLSAPAFAGRVVVRSYDTSDGLSHIHVRDILQDSQGYMWFATWTGVDRFDGYEFRHFRTYPGDEVRLDNNRIERLAQSPDGRILVMTYTRRIYALDSATGAFSMASAADSTAFDGLRKARHKLCEGLKNYPTAGSRRYVDASGNMWLIRKEGVDYVSLASDAFRFVDATPIDTTGEDIHALYAAPDGRLWTASRDSRVMIYGPDGAYEGNLRADGAVVPDPLVGCGVRPYAFVTDSLGRVWMGTKSGQLWVLSPRGTGRYDIDRYYQSDAPGALACADVYGFAADAKGNIWLATFGRGVARSYMAPDGSPEFYFPEGQPAAIARARRMYAVCDTLMVVAGTRGVAAFNPAETYPRFGCIGSTTEERLSNEDILDICPAADGKVYLAAFSGGIDYVGAASELMSAEPRIYNLNTRNVLDAEPVLSVIQTADSDFWVASAYAVSRYGSGWELKATYDSGNLGRPVRPTEARPQLMPDGRLVFGLTGGLLFIEPAAISGGGLNGFVVTGFEYGSERFCGLGADSTIVLPRGVRELAVHFASLDYAGGANVRYSYRLDDDAATVSLGRERSVRLSSLPSGNHTLHVYRTDAYGSRMPGSLDIKVEVPRTWREVAGELLVFFAGVFLLCMAAWAVVRSVSRRRQRRMFERCVERALDAAHASADASLPERMCAFIGANYSDASIKAGHVSQALGIGRSELRREVKNYLGMSLEDFLRVVRVRAAARMLRAGGCTVAEVAYACGFSTPQYMAMVFKDIMGCTPSDYSEKAGRRH